MHRKMLRPRPWPLSGFATAILILSMTLTLGCPPPADEPQPVVQEGGAAGQRPADFDERPDVLSPPIVEPRPHACGTAVQVRGFIPDAEIEVQADIGGTIERLGGGRGLDPEGQIFVLDRALEAGWVVTATQAFAGFTSGPSPAQTVRPYTEDYPEGLPRPTLWAEPLYECGRSTVVGSLPLGGSVEVLSDGSERLGSAQGVGESHTVGVHPPFRTPPQQVTAVSDLCADPSEPSEPRWVEDPPAELPVPELEEMYEEGVVIVLGRLVNGAAVTIERGADRLFTGSTPAGRARFRLSEPVAAGDTLRYHQELCGVSSPDGTTTVQPCSALPNPVIVAPEAGDTRLRLENVVAGSRILILADGEEIGDGGGSEIELTRPLEWGEHLVAIQMLGDCVSTSTWELDVGTGLPDPAEPGLCEVALPFEYGADDSITTDITTFFGTPALGVVPWAAPVHGTVRYPAGPGRFPLVLVVHGNHDPYHRSDLGYDYLLELLASHCMIAVSVDENYLNYARGEMDARALVLLAHLQTWRGWDRDPANRFFTKVDLGRVGLVGHSRGGEAITVATKLNAWMHQPGGGRFDFDFGIRALFAIAPVDRQIAGDESLPMVELRDSYPLDNISVGRADYFIMHGSHDADVADFQGHRTYDRAAPANGYKGLLWVQGADHAQWNEIWACSCVGGPCGPVTSCDSVESRVTASSVPQITRAAQQQIGKSYLGAFMMASLRGWATYRTFFSGEATFPSLPAGVTRVTQYEDADHLSVNHYQEDDDLGTGSQPGVLNRTVGTVSPYADHYFYDRGPDYWQWQETDGLILGWTGGTDRELVIEVPPEVAEQTADYPYLALRVGQVYDPSGLFNSAGVSKDFTVELRFASGLRLDRRVSQYLPLPYPDFVDGTWTLEDWARDRGYGHPPTKTVMSTVRIPWQHFFPETGVLPADLTEIRLRFDQHQNGLLAIDDIQLSH